MLARAGPAAVVRRIYLNPPDAAVVLCVDEKSQAVVEIMGKLQGLLEEISESTVTSAPPTKR